MKRVVAESLEFFARVGILPGCDIQIDTESWAIQPASEHAKSTEDARKCRRTRRIRSFVSHDPRPSGLSRDAHAGEDIGRSRWTGFCDIHVRHTGENALLPAVEDRLAVLAPSNSIDVRFGLGGVAIWAGWNHFDRHWIRSPEWKDGRMEQDSGLNAMYAR